MVGHLYISIDGSIDEGCISPSAIGGVVKIYGIINAKTAKKIKYNHVLIDLDWPPQSLEVNISHLYLKLFIDTLP